MLALRVLLTMLGLATLRGHEDRDFDFRWQLSEAIVNATDDEHEQDVLARIAWFESSYRRSVARCEVLGDGGKSRGVFQTQGMSEADRKAGCGTLPQQVEVALRYVRRSAEMCPKNEGAAMLNLYVSGRCDRGLVQARARWGSP